MTHHAENSQVGSLLRKLLARWRPALNLALAAGLLAGSHGCTRRFFRERADKDVSEIIAHKDKYPDWKVENWWVYPHPLSRFADPTNPDRPPMPPDDPAAYCLSPNPQHVPHAGIKRIEGNGYLELIAQWDRENRERREKAQESEKPSVEPPLPPGPDAGAPEESEPQAPADPQRPAPAAPAPGGPDKYTSAPIPGQRDALAEARARSLLDISGRPAYLMTLDQAAELAMFNNRQFQDQRENLYLAALPVSLERFSFMAQFFAASQAMRTSAGPDAPGGHQNNWALNNGIGVGKVLPTGALLLLNFSNQTVFNFLNPKSTTSVSTLDFTAIQPLLRDGGKAVALESLTLAERNLLYAIRNYARFRKELYVFIASNNGGAISGSAFQPSGVLSGNGTVTVGGFGNSGLAPGVPAPLNLVRNGVQVAPASPGTLFTAGAITPTPTGYLNTMLEKITVYIDQENIDTLSDILQRFRGLLEGDQVGPLQVQNVEQQLLAGRSTLIADQQNLLQSLDAFKLEIGVPVTLSIEMDDSELRPLTQQFRHARAIIEDEHAAATEASALIRIEQAPKLRAALRRLFQSSALVRGTPFARTIGGEWAPWEKLTAAELAARLDALQKEIKKLLDLQAELQGRGQPMPAAESARLRQLTAELDLGTFERLLRQYEAAYTENGQPKKPAPADERRRINQFQGVLSAWSKVLVRARDDRWANVRSDWPELPRVCVDGVDLIKDDLDRAEETADRHALLNRLDLMNTRAQVVDAWRQLAVYANALLGTFTVQYNLSASTPATVAQPLNFHGSATSNQLVLNASPPLARVAERNNYRVAQIAYQRQRRSLQQAEDLTTQAVNIELTNMRQYAEQYKIQQRQLELAYLTIDSALESLQAPVAPAPPPGLARTQADGPAALTQQLLAAQRSLPAAQNALLQIWINYMDQRLQLYRDLELMPLDARGVWIDKIKECECPPDAEKAPPEAKAPPAMLLAVVKMNSQLDGHEEGGRTCGRRGATYNGRIPRHQEPAMIRVVTHSEPGGHAANEDAFVVAAHPEDAEVYLCAVADGWGGQFGGGAAARLACETFLKVASQATPAELMLLRHWDDILAHVDRTVAGDALCGFTTLVAFCVARGGLAGASCGDSALVVAEPEQEPLVLTARQSKNPPVGSGAAVFVPFAIHLHAPWTALALSDGVWKYVGWDAVLQAAARAAGEDVIKSLRQRAALPGSGALQDDFTLVVLRGEGG